MYMCMCIYIKGKLPSNLGGCFTLTTYHLFAIPVCFNSPACHLLLTSHAVPPFFFFFSIFNSPYSLYDNDMLPFLDSSHLFIFVVFLYEPVAYSIQCTPFPFLLNSYSSLSSLPPPFNIYLGVTVDAP